MHVRSLLLVATLSALAAIHPSGAEVIRYPIPNSTFPIAQAVEVKGNVSTFYVSGQVPPVVDTAFDTNTREAYGDTKTQTVGVLKRIKTILDGFGLGMGDVVKMQVFLVHTPASPMDFKAFMDGYTQFFGGTQPNLPARSVVGVASLANPGFLVEIEVIAVKNAQGPQ
jgi:enamine deaminase RidA (YjgF/YER057c/UK114 family)